MSAETIIEGLETTILPYYDQQYGRRADGSSNYFILWDNAPPHTAAIIQDWLDDQDIDFLYIPPHSPDLNPIENLFAQWRNILDKNYPAPANINILEEQVRASWIEISTMETINCYKNTMINRLRAVVEKEGRYTGY